jgi:hypothetical protein
MDARLPYERDPEPRLLGGQHGPPLGDRGLRRDEEPLYRGEVQPRDKRVELCLFHGVPRGRSGGWGRPTRGDETAAGAVRTHCCTCHQSGDTSQASALVDRHSDHDFTLATPATTNVANLFFLQTLDTVAKNMDRHWAIGGYDGMKNLSTVDKYKQVELCLFCGVPRGRSGGRGRATPDDETDAGAVRKHCCTCHQACLVMTLGLCSR